MVDLNEKKFDVKLCQTQRRNLVIKQLEQPKAFFFLIQKEYYSDKRKDFFSFSIFFLPTSKENMAKSTTSCFISFMEYDELEEWMLSMTMHADGTKRSFGRKIQGEEVRKIRLILLLLNRSAIWRMKCRWFQCSMIFALSPSLQVKLWHHVHKEQDAFQYFELVLIDCGNHYVQICLVFFNRNLECPWVKLYLRPKPDLIF